MVETEHNYVIKQVSYFEKIQNSLGNLVKNINMPFLKIFKQLDTSPRKSRKSLALMNSRRFQSFTSKKMPSISVPKIGAWDSSTTHVTRPKAASFMVNVKEATSPKDNFSQEVANFQMKKINSIKLSNSVRNSNNAINIDTNNTMLEEDIPKTNNMYDRNNLDNLEKIQEESNSKDSESVFRDNKEVLTIPEIKLGKINGGGDSYRHSLAPSSVHSQLVNNKNSDNQKLRSSLRLPSPSGYLSVDGDRNE